MEERLIELETRLAWQEDSLRALDDVIRQQELRIQHLEAVQRALLERITQFSALLDAGTAPADEKPPHY